MFWVIEQKGCFGEYDFSATALAAHIRHPAFILQHQNLVNDHLFTKSAKLFQL